jgi:lipopolysaccharide/colanic/teichoic acid biosynthesis glycosyltransferase
MTSFVDAARLNNLARMVRRVADVLGALLGLTLLALLLPLLAPGIYLESGFPIIFRQMRIGQGGRLFTIFKFRSMRVGAESDGAPRWAELRDPRVTRVGRFLRRTRLDEFPQFWNVLRGEMALVGPRPERPEFVAELEQKIPLYRLRLRVKPGLTGWAQINFGYGASVEDSEKKLQYDLYYIKQRGPLLDLVILFRTIGVMFGFRGR